MVEHPDESDEPMPLRTKVIAGVVAFVLLIVAAAVIVRLSSPAIAADEAPPAGHYGLPCGLCHTVTAAPAAVTS